MTLRKKPGNQLDTAHSGDMLLRHRGAAPHQQNERITCHTKREWAEHLTEYFASQGNKESNGDSIVVEGSFPWKKAL